MPEIEGVRATYDDLDDGDAWEARCREDWAYGFRWEQILVTRISAVQRGPGATYKCLRIEGEEGAAIDVYVTPKGRRIRVFADGKEWHP